jgi:hypothetical protein
MSSRTELLYTCDEAKANLKEALEARSKVLNAKMYSMENSRNSQRRLERESLANINADIEKWEQVVLAVCGDSCTLDIKQGLPVE